MIANLLPRTVSSAELGHDPPGVTLPVEEESLIAHAVPSRRAAFTSGRLCARRALAGLGFAPVPIPRGDRREPRWPDGVVGSITHCAGYRAAAVARAGDVAAIGIDAEPSRPLPDGVLAAVALPAEMDRIAELSNRDPTVPWDRLLFSIKESVYKAWFPLTRHRLTFADAEVTIIPGAFTARIQPRDGHPAHLTGRWQVAAGLVVTAIAVSTLR